MSKREIQRALQAKGLECSLIEYNWQATPGEMAAGWDIELTPECEDKIATVDPDFADWQPDCFNTAEALEWVETLPNVKGI